MAWSKIISSKWMWERGGNDQKPAKNTKRQRKIKEAKLTSSASTLPLKTNRESFLGCVADLLLNIHGINNYSFIKPGKRERKSPVSSGSSQTQLLRTSVMDYLNERLQRGFFYYLNFTLMDVLPISTIFSTIIF